MRIKIVNFLPTQARMRQILITVLKFEIFLDVYIIVSTLVAKFTAQTCENGNGHPQRTNELFIAGVIIPFFVIKLLVLNCCTSPQSVVSQMFLLWILQPMVQAVWDVYAIYTLFTFSCKPFNLPIFNLYFLITLNFAAVLYLFVFIPYMAVRYCRNAE